MMEPLKPRTKNALMNLSSNNIYNLAIKEEPQEIMELKLFKPKIEKGLDHEEPMQHSTTQDFEKTDIKIEQSLNTELDMISEVSLKNKQKKPKTNKKTIAKTVDIPTDAEVEETVIYFCETCNKYFPSWSKLFDHNRKHLKRKHKDIAKTKNKTKINLPKRSSSIETNTYACDVCNKKFTFQTNMKRHKQLHLNLKPHICELCGKAFKRKYLLSQHLHVHKGQKPYACEECHMHFTTKNILRQHLQLHNDRTFMCDYCEKKFKRKFNLMTHILSHIKEIKKTNVKV